MLYGHRNRGQDCRGTVRDEMQESQRMAQTGERNGVGVASSRCSKLLLTMAMMMMGVSHLG